MRASEIRALGTEDIRRKLDQIYEELFNLRFQWAAGQIEDHNRITGLRRDLARMRTILRERELAREMLVLSKVEGKEGAA